MKNKLLNFLFVFIILISLTGCGGKKEEKIDVMPLYEKYLKEEKYKELFVDGEARNYTFKDLNKDGTVELIIEGNYLKNYIRTIIVAYNSETKDVYEVFNSYNASGVLYNEENNQLLFISRDYATKINYYYAKLVNNQEKLETVKSYGYSINSHSVKTRDNRTSEEGVIDSLEARREADTYEYIGMTYTMDGKEIEKTKRNIFEEYDINGFKINNVTLSYGLYKTKNGNLSIYLYPDGTCYYKGASNRYKGGTVDIVGFYHANGNKIEIWKDSLSKEEFTVTKNDNMYSSWLSLDLIK